MKTHGRRNWPLRIGSAIVLGVVAVAILGPWLAPQELLAGTPVLQINGRWSGPPYPLGHPASGWAPIVVDHGLSRLFSPFLPYWRWWPSLRPCGLGAGLSLGLAAGYLDGAWRRTLDLILRLALTFPVLVVALAVIAFVGIQRGLLASVPGLCLTGWAETARYVETQTRTTRTHPFGEAARSMGAGDRHIVIYHILRHVLPLASMLLALEVSSTLMTVAALGFLGYDIGGAPGSRWKTLSRGLRPVCQSWGRCWRSPWSNSWTPGRWCWSAAW